MHEDLGEASYQLCAESVRFPLMQDIPHLAQERSYSS